FLNRLLESLERTVVDPLAVYEERRRAQHLRRRPIRHVLLDHRLEPSRLNGLVIVGEVESDLTDPLPDALVADLREPLEHPVVQLPELALALREEGGRGRLPGVLVDVQRVLFVNHLYVLRKRLQDLIE